MSFDPTKPVQTRDGRKARILATDLKAYCGQSVVAIVTGLDGDESLLQFQKEGSYLYGREEHRTDLVNIPERRVLRYRVALFRIDGIDFLAFAENFAAATCLNSQRGFVEWLGDWREVEVAP